MTGENVHGSFDERAADWDTPEKIAQAEIVARTIRAAVDIGPETRILEYGAGTALATQHIAHGPVGPLTLADPSTGMREVMTQKVASGQLPAGTEIVDVDLATEERYRDAFDLIITVMALHHVPEPAPLIAGFGRALAVGGTLCLIDLDTEPGLFHADTGADVHHGFDRHELSSWLADAGLTEVRVDTLTTLQRDGRAFPLFIALSQRSS